MSEGTGKTTIFSVAKYILQKCDEMSTMKLQKLCYYAQAWYLVWNNEPLFAEDFQAWANGPVCRELFKKYQGKFNVSKADFAEYDDMPEELQEDVDDVLDFYAEKSGQWLSELTHKERPWKETRLEHYAKPGDYCDAVIQKELIYDYYAGISDV